MSDSDTPKTTKLRQNQKPRHVPSFVPLKDDAIERMARSVATREESEDILAHYEFGTIGLRRYAVTHQEEVDGYIEDFSKRSTRLTNDTTDRTVVTVGFTGRKKRWTLCPSSDCIPKADKREKIVGQWKFLHLPPKGDDLVVPKCVHEAYSEVVDDCSYFAATLCPQQTYCAKHSNQPGFINREWHEENRHVYALADFLVFCDNMQKVRGVWRLMTVREKYNGGPETAESNLIKVMMKVLHSIRDRATRSQSMYSMDPEPPMRVPEDELAMCLAAKSSGVNVCMGSQGALSKAVSHEEFQQMYLQNGMVMAPCPSTQQPGGGQRGNIPGGLGDQVATVGWLQSDPSAIHFNRLRNVKTEEDPQQQADLQNQYQNAVQPGGARCQNSFHGSLLQMNGQSIGFAQAGTLTTSVPCSNPGSNQQLLCQLSLHQPPPQSRMTLVQQQTGGVNVQRHVEQQVPVGDTWLVKQSLSPVDNSRNCDIPTYPGDNASSVTHSTSPQQQPGTGVPPQMLSVPHPHHQHVVSANQGTQVGAKPHVSEQQQDPHQVSHVKLESHSQQGQQIHHHQSQQHQSVAWPGTIQPYGGGVQNAVYHVVDGSGQRAVMLVNYPSLGVHQQLVSHPSGNLSQTYVLAGNGVGGNINSSSPLSSCRRSPLPLEGNELDSSGVQMAVSLGEQGASQDVSGCLPLDHRCVGVVGDQEGQLDPQDQQPHSMPGGPCYKTEDSGSDPQGLYQQPVHVKPSPDSNCSDSTSAPSRNGSPSTAASQLTAAPDDSPSPPQASSSVLLAPPSPSRDGNEWAGRKRPRDDVSSPHGVMCVSEREQGQMDSVFDLHSESITSRPRLIEYR